MIRHIHGGNAGKGILDFSVSVNPFKPLETTNGSWRDLRKELFRYPEPFCETLKSSLAKSLKIKDENLLIGNGSIDLIYLVTRAIHPKKAVVVHPTFAEYEYALKLVNSRATSFFMKENDSFVLDTDDLAKDIPRNGLVFICNPNNPTGKAIERKKLLKLAAACWKKKAILAIDEAFIEFVDRPGEFSLLYDAPKNPNMLILRSLTKTYSVPGIRMGYLVGHKRLIEIIAKHQMPWAVNSIAQALTKAVLNDGRYLRKSLRDVAKERRRLYSSLSKMEGIKPYESSANFIMCRINSGSLTSLKLKEALLKKRILIRDLSNMKGLGRRYFRVAVKMRKENDILIDALKGVIRAG